jgi:hypothetical protein
MSRLTQTQIRRAISLVLATTFVFPSPWLLTPCAWASTSTPYSGTDDCTTPPSGCGDCSDPACPAEGDMADGSPPPETSSNPVHFNLNSAIEREVDIAVPGSPLGWQHTRTYDSRLGRGINAFQSFGFEGYRWHGGGTGHYLRGSATSDIELYLNATNKRVFRFTDQGDSDPNNDGHIAPIESALTIVRSGNDDGERYTVTNTETGSVSIYHGLNGAVDVKNQGRLETQTTRALIVAGKPGNTFYYDSYGSVEWVAHVQLKRN